MDRKTKAKIIEENVMEQYEIVDERDQDYLDILKENETLTKPNK